MKAAEVKIIQSLKSYINKQFPGYEGLTIDFSEVSKKNGVEKSDISMTFHLNDVTDSFCEEGFSGKLKDALTKTMKVSVPFLSFSATYAEDGNGIGVFTCSLCFRLDTVSRR